MIKIIFLNIIRFYQLFISPYLGLNCRFYPSCSKYTEQAILKYGFIKGSWKGLKRILKCAPWGQGGVNMP